MTGYIGRFLLGIENVWLRWFVFIILMIIALFPGIIAMVKDRPNKATVVLINLTCGWTIIAWFIALMMALKEPSDNKLLDISRIRKG